MNVLGLREVKSVDRDGLWAVYRNWPAAIRRALSQPLELPKERSYTSVVLAGMGGSGSACDILADWLRSKSRVPVTVVKDYALPAFSDRGTLAVFVSLGGETKETRSLVRKSVERGCSTVIVASGGSIERLSNELRVPFNRVQSLLVPRASIPSMTIVAARIVAAYGLVDAKPDFERCATEVEKALSRAEASVPLGRNFSKRLARQLHGKDVAVYSPAATASVATHFKNSMNENAKVPIQVETYPELFHNEVETWVSRRNRAVLMLRVAELEENTAGELRRLQQLFRKFRVPVTELRADSCDLSTYLSWCLLLDLASVYLAVLERREPAPTPILSSMKKS